jgi:hypothetical protein
MTSRLSLQDEKSPVPLNPVFRDYMSNSRLLKKGSGPWSLFVIIQASMHRDLLESLCTFLL